MNLSKEFKGWNKMTLKDKSDELQAFFIRHYEEIGHYGLDDICSRLFDFYHDEEE